MACKVASSVGLAIIKLSKSCLQSSSLPIRKRASALKAFAQSEFGVFLRTLSHSCKAFLLFPLSNQSTIKENWLNGTNKHNPTSWWNFIKGQNRDQKIVMSITEIDITVNRPESSFHYQIILMHVYIRRFGHRPKIIIGYVFINIHSNEHLKMLFLLVHKIPLGFLNLSFEFPLEPKEITLFYDC